MTQTETYFANLNQQLRSAGNGRPSILLDLDRLDHNIDEIRGSLGDRLRIVTKSLPCLQLLDYLLDATDCSRLMVFHQPYLPIFLKRYPNVSVLMGKPLLAPGVEEVLSKFDSSELSAALARVEWLVDTPDSLMAMGEVARSHGATLNINVEIDVGLGRGGVTVQSPDSHGFPHLAAVFKQFDDHLNWSGLMGYDAHVPFMGDDVSAAFATTMNRYQELYEFATKALPSDGGPLTLNSGGSHTYPLFSSGVDFVSDISVGSAFLKPARFNRLANLEPALFIAAPTLKQFPRPHPSHSNPDLDTISYVYGGGWPGELVWPACVKTSSRDDAPNENLMPNQSMIHKSSTLDHDVGDYVFLQPHQSDAMFQFEDILVFAKGELVDRWQPVPLRY